MRTLIKQSNKSERTISQQEIERTLRQNDHNVQMLKRGALSKRSSAEGRKSETPWSTSGDIEQDGGSHRRRLVHSGERTGAGCLLMLSTILPLYFPVILKSFTSFKKHKEQQRKYECLGKDRELALCFGAV